MVQLRVAGAAETLTITCPSLAEAESLADLIDGYCRLHNNTTTSLWSCKGMALKFVSFMFHASLGMKHVCLKQPYFEVKIVQFRFRNMKD